MKSKFSKINFHKNNISRNSITYKMTMIILVVMLLSVLIAGLCASVFIERFYVKSKQVSIKALYHAIYNVSLRDNNIEKNSNQRKLDALCEKAGAAVMLIDTSGMAVYDYSGGEVLSDRWKDMIFGANIGQKSKPTVIEENENYILQSTIDKISNNKYYELHSDMPSGNYLIIRVSVESLKESISIANKFYFILCLPVIVIITASMIALSRKYTIPILQLAELSRRMSNLDFDAKYIGNRDDEIGILGESMNDMSKELEATITELKNANIKLHRDIKKKEEVDEMRKEFISNVSHELKTPIALIQGYAEGLQEGISDNPEDMEYYCNVIVDEAAKMNKMVVNLLNLNQLEFGDNKINIERFDIAATVNGVVSRMNIAAEQNNCVITIESPKSIDVWADEFQIEQVITNYLSNALNHVDENKLIRVKVSEKNGIVRVSVFNSGKNILEEDIDNIWIKFYKVDKARTRAYGGNGIGLSIVKAIMDGHKKDYGVINKENGVEFWFELDSKKGTEK